MSPRDDGMRGRAAAAAAEAAAASATKSATKSAVKSAATSAAKSAARSGSRPTAKADATAPLKKAPAARPAAAAQAGGGVLEALVTAAVDGAGNAVATPRQPRSGTQSIERAVLVLKELAAQPHFGWRATDLAARCGLDRATTHRILASLARSRLAQQRPSDKRYMIGPLLFELAVGLPGMEELRRLSEDAMERLARRTHAVAFFYLRSGNDFTCLARAGTAPIQSLMFEVGTRRPLMSSAGGVAILLAMPPAECAAAVAENRTRLRRWETPMDGIERIWEESVRTGRAVNRAATVAGWNAFAVAVRDAQGAPFGAVMLAGIADEFPGSREEAHREMLAETAATIERALARGFERSKRIHV